MAVSFIEQKQRQKKLIIVLILIILAIILILWLGDFFKKPIPLMPEIETVYPKTVEINFEVLKEQLIGKLRLFTTKPFEEIIGRENPFVPY